VGRLESHVEEKVARRKAEMMAFLGTQLSEETVTGFENSLPEPKYGYDRVSRKAGRDETGKVIIRSGKVLDFRLRKWNFSVITSRRKLDLHFGITWMYDIQWDDGELQRDVCEDDLL